MSTVGRRYARALFDLANEGPGFEPIGRELARVAEAFESEPIAALVGGRSLDSASREKLVAGTVAKAGFSPLVGSFLRVLATRNRLGALEAIESEYRELADEKAGRVRAIVKSARSLDDASLGELTRALGRALGKEVVAEVQLDPELLGGVVVEVGGRVYDGSVASQLSRLRTALAG